MEEAAMALLKLMRYERLLAAHKVQTRALNEIPLKGGTLACLTPDTVAAGIPASSFVL